MPSASSLRWWLMAALSRSDEQFRDATIIRFGAEPELNGGKEPVAIVRYLSEKDLPRPDSSIDYPIAAPMILLEGDRQRHGIAHFYFDPPSEGPPIPLSLYLPKWAGFSRLLLSTKKVGGTRQCDYAFDLLQRAVVHCRDTHGPNRADALAQSVHDHRWSLGPEMTAHLLTLATLGTSQPSDTGLLSAESETLAAAIASVRTALVQAKQSCCDLTEWCEALYSINPRVWKLLTQLKSSDLRDGESYWRFFAEVDADIAPCSMRDVFTVIHAETGDDGPSWRSHFLSMRDDAADLKEFKEKLQYLLHARTSIPKFWVELAVASYDLPAEKLPSALDNIDPWRAVSTNLLRAASLRWRLGE